MELMRIVLQSALFYDGVKMQQKQLFNALGEDAYMLYNQEPACGRCCGVKIQKEEGNELKRSSSQFAGEKLMVS